MEQGHPARSSASGSSVAVQSRLRGSHRTERFIRTPGARHQTPGAGESDRRVDRSSTTENH
ncbi:hypothetical protein EYF80_050523 [Liparis tanakae]|uniref:Uncharacterized protein n=1 Tax=Liparis tanakae TaxID=230148 RepID=A0A4Z2FDT7_9TELE|nr:hypothetical protein EYF80_050523 [Liparis tanakae]